MKDASGVSPPRKAMIRCGLAFDTDGASKVQQLFPHLQEVVQKHRMNFCGVIPENPFQNEF